MGRQQTQQQSGSNTVASLATLTANTNNIANDIADIKYDIRDMKNSYVTKDRFDPIEKVVYGLVALILIAVVGAVIALALNHPAIVH